VKVCETSTDINRFTPRDAASQKWRWEGTLDTRQKGHLAPTSELNVSHLSRSDPRALSFAQ